MNEENLEHIGVAIIIVDPQTNKILLGERMNAYKAGYFGLPGGRIEMHETAQEAIVREVLEETGLTIINTEYVGVVRELQETYNFIHFGMTTTSFSGTLGNPEPHKCKGWEWYNLDNIPEKILPGHKALLDIFTHEIKEQFVDLGHE